MADTHYTPETRRSALGRLARAHRHHPDGDHTGLQTAVVAETLAHAARELHDKYPGVTLTQDQARAVLAAVTK